MSLRWPHQYRVTGRGDFPNDMLRYDEADFATLMDDGLAVMMSHKRTVSMVGEVEPHVERWASFGWTVDHIEPLARGPKS